jgi:hypothetical protein
LAVGWQAKWWCSVRWDWIQAHVIGTLDDVRLVLYFETTRESIGFGLATRESIGFGVAEMPTNLWRRLSIDFENRYLARSSN